MGAGEAERKKQNKNETKNIFGYCLDGIKECNGQDSYHYFGFEVDNTNIKFMGVYDGHGIKGKEASLFINNAIKKLITDNKNTLKSMNTTVMATIITALKNYRILTWRQLPEMTYIIY